MPVDLNYREFIHLALEIVRDVDPRIILSKYGSNKLLRSLQDIYKANRPLDLETLHKHDIDIKEDSLEKICGEAQKSLFVGFTDLLQEFVGLFIPDWWPMNYVEDCFDKIFNKVQDQMKPIAYQLGYKMGEDIENKVEAWIKSRATQLLNEINKAKSQALKEINSAFAEIRKHTDQIQNLLERVAALEGKSKFEIPYLDRRFV